MSEPWVDELTVHDLFDECGGERIALQRWQQLRSWLRQNGDMLITLAEQPDRSRQ